MDCPSGRVKNLIHDVKEFMDGRLRRR